MGVLLWWSCQSPVAHRGGLLNHPTSFCGGTFKLNAKFDADFLLYSLSHFECNGYTVHMLTQWCLLSPLTSAMKLSLFTDAHSSPLSLAARLHQCHAHHSHYINNGWTFSGQTSYSWSHSKSNVCLGSFKPCWVEPLRLGVVGIIAQPKSSWLTNCPFQTLRNPGFWNHLCICPWSTSQWVGNVVNHSLLTLPPESDTNYFCSCFIGQNRSHGHAQLPCAWKAHQMFVNSLVDCSHPYTKDLIECSYLVVIPPKWMVLG